MIIVIEIMDSKHFKSASECIAVPCSVMYKGGKMME
jgi:hypothetical protein